MAYILESVSSAPSFCKRIVLYMLNMILCDLLYQADTQYVLQARTPLRFTTHVYASMEEYADVFEWLRYTRKNR